LHKEITEAEVRAAIFRSNPKKAPGPDDIPFLVWQRIWEEAKGSIMVLYKASLRLGHLPDSWRTARIVPLRKPGKPDYTVPKAFRPISLLATISKGLEAVVANRLSFMAEKHNLLPSNHFGARKRRSCEQAVNVLVHRIYEQTCYWMDWKIHWIMPRISYGFYRKSSNLDRKPECNHEDGAFSQPASSDRPFLVHLLCVLS
jgi:hypothetical protein